MTTEILERANAQSPTTLALALRHPPPSTFSTFRDRHKLSLSLYDRTTISNSHLTACFNLVRDNLQRCYEESCFGWDPIDKLEEMREPDTKYLILTRPPSHDSPSSPDVGDTAATVNSYSDNNEVLGFLSFQMVEEDEDPVIYCYEIQLVPTVRGKGIGTLLLSAMHRIAVSNNINKAMLRVFTANEGAVRFYEREGYTVHASSPKERRLRGRKVRADYAVLVKSLNVVEGDQDGSEGSCDGDGAQWKGC